MSDPKTDIRIVTDASARQATRPLYEQAFDDPAAFVDYYYREKCNDNVMVVKYDGDGRILSMLHLNPYTLSLKGKRIPSYYVVAVATDEGCRRQGHMADVLKRTFAYLGEEKIPFCFLLPVDEAIYTPFGFRKICDFITREDPRSRISYETVKRHYDLYCVRDERYLMRKREEDALYRQGIAELLPDHPVIMARVTDRAALCALLSLREDATEETCLEKLGLLRAYFTEEV